MKITSCKKICSTCALNGNSKDTLYAETYEIINQGKIFPCHEYLKSKTGCEYFGTESLQEIKVCRGYVAYMKLNRPELAMFTTIWEYLFNKIDVSELEDILSMKELEQNHKGLRDKIYLGN